MADQGLGLTGENPFYILTERFDRVQSCVTRFTPVSCWLLRARRSFWVRSAERATRVRKRN